MAREQFKSFFCFSDGSLSTQFWIVKLGIKLILSGREKISLPLYIVL